MASTVLEDMFADARDTRERGDRLEALKKSLNESVQRHDKKVDAFVPAAQAPEGGRIGIVKGAGSGAPKRPSVSDLERIAQRFAGQMEKGLSETDAASAAADFEMLNALKESLEKDISTTIPGNLHPYDLEAPAKQLVPRFTPLRNDISRSKAQGTAREYRRILGYTNTGMGGVADQTPFFNSEAALNTSQSGAAAAGLPNFGALQLIRGQKISYAMDVQTLPYMEMSLSDSVGWKAQFANLGFENSRALSQMALLWAHLLGEEKAILWGRGTASGYSGTVAAPAVGTVTASTTPAGPFAASAWFVKVTSYTGMGESLPGTEKTVTPGSAGSSLAIPITPVSGAVSYGVYVGSATNTETFQGFFVPAAGVNTITLTTYSTTGKTVPTSEGSALSTAYDGIIPNLLTNGGYKGYFPSLVSAGQSVYNPANTAANNVGDKPWQDMFASLFGSVYADPEEVWLDFRVRRQLADWLRANQTSAGAYRLNVDHGEFSGSGVEVGGFVSGIANESSPTNRIVDLRVHPYMPSGVSFARTRHLPIPDSGIGDTSEMLEVQGYMSVDWPEIQFTYDSSTYWYGALVHYAPTWSGIITALQ